MSLFGIHLFYTWLTMTPHRRPGSNKVQESLTTLAHQGKQGYSATKTQTQTQMDLLSRAQIDKSNVSRHTEKSPLLLERGRQSVWPNSLR